MKVLAVAMDLLHEARSRRWVLALGLGVTALLLLVAFGLELEVVDGALAASRFLGDRASSAIRPADVALRPLFGGVALVIFYGGIVFGVLADDPRFFDEFRRSTGIDLLKDVDRVGLAGESLVVSGFLDRVRWEELEKLRRPEAYGEAGVLYRLPGGGPVVTRWRDQVVVFSPDAATGRQAIDQLEGRAAPTAPALDEALSYGEVYGVIPGAAVRRFFPRDAEIGARLAAAASRVELHVDAMQDVAAVVRVNGQDQAALSDLARTIGGGLAAGRLQAKATGDRELAELLDAASVAPEDGRFSIELAVPAATLERWFEGCAGASPAAAAAPSESR